MVEEDGSTVLSVAYANISTPCFCIDLRIVLCVPASLACCLRRRLPTHEFLERRALRDIRRLCGDNKDHNFLGLSLELRPLTLWDSLILLW